MSRGEGQSTLRRRLGHRDKLFEMAGFVYFDADGDGRITLAELIDKPNPAFALPDTNHDCVIVPEERRGSDGNYTR